MDENENPVVDGKNENKKPVLDGRYYQDGERWENSIYRTTAASRSAWRAVAVFAVVAVACATGIIVMMVPLKTVEIQIVEVDRNTGFVEMKRPLEEGGVLSQNEAVTQSNIVRFIRARETYDPKGLGDNYDLAQLFSTGAASQDLGDLYKNSNPQNPKTLWGPDTIISATVESISFLNAKTASVRFFTTRSNSQGDIKEHWVANVRYRYTGAPMRTDYRFDNPLGFQVTEYRRDQETVAPEVKQVQP